MAVNDKVVLGLDADGVLLNYLSGFFAYVRSKGLHVACEPEEVTDWSCSNAFPDWSAEEIYRQIEDFSVQPEFAHIPPIPGAVEAIRGIKEDLGNVEVIAITSAGKSDETIRLRRKNLELFPFDDIHVLPLGASKQEHLALLPAGSVFVDDLFKHVQSAEKVGVTGILFRQSYNVADSHPHVIADWRSGRDVVRSLLEPSRAAVPA